MKKSQFVTALNCMDGRAQLPVIRYLKRKYRAAFVDTITEPGIVRVLASRQTSSLRASVNKRLNISTKKHHSRRVAVVAHHDCAGNPVAAKRQKEQLKAAVLNLKTQNNELDVIGLWLGSDWKIQEVC